MRRRWVVAFVLPVLLGGALAVAQNVIGPNGHPKTTFLQLFWTTDAGENNRLSRIDGCLQNLSGNNPACPAGGGAGPTGPTGPTGATGATGPTGGGGGGVQSAVVDLTTAQIATLQSAPVTIVPAPGTGMVVVPIAVSVQSVVATNPFFTSDDLYVSWGLTNASVAMHPAWDTVGSHFITGGLDSTNATLSVDENAPLVIRDDTEPALTGAILTSSVNVAGTGYAPGDTGTVGNPLAGTPALYTVDTVNGGGGVLTYHLTNNGTQYGPQSGLPTTVTTGGGDGAFTIDVNTITPLSDGVARVQVLYYVMTLR